jgi:hypothetical protein
MKDSMAEAVKRIRPILAGLLLAGTCAGALLSCSQEPTPENSLVAVGPLSGFATRETLITATSTWFQRIYSPMNGVVNLTGRTGNFQAYSLIQFFPSSFPARDTINVQEARLRLRAITWYGSRSANFSFTVYRIARSWSSSTVTWDSLQAGFYDSQPRGVYSVTATSDTFDMTLNLDTAMVREWFKTSTSTTDTKYGIILVPDGSTTDCARGAYSFNSGDTANWSPQLTVIATNTAGTTRDTTVFTSGQDTFVGTDEFAPADPSLFPLHAGVNYRSGVRFDLSGIPRGSILNKAELVLHQDPATSRLSPFTADTLISPHFLYSDTSLTSNFSTEDQAMHGRQVPGNPTVFTFDIRKIVQAWLRGPNYGALLRFTSADEFSSAELITFFGAAADSSRRPSLRIIYSNPVR